MDDQPVRPEWPTGTRSSKRSTTRDVRRRWQWEQRGIPAVQFAQSDSRMIPASQALYDCVMQQHLVFSPGFQLCPRNTQARRLITGTSLSDAPLIQLPTQSYNSVPS